MNRELEGLVALVTGAASDIGQATALAFAPEGARVVVSDLDGRSGEQTVVQIRRAGGDARFAAADVSKDSNVIDLLEATLKAYGRLDIAFNNAAISGAQGAVAELSEMQWAEVMAVNLSGIFLCMKHELAQMEKQGMGSIINNASLLGAVGVAGAAFTASKHGVLGLTHAAAIEYAPKGIRVNAVCRFGAPAEAAEAVTFLASPRASFVSGHPLLVDSGFAST
jgi:NAD(P)-dependent dehydrogenase (short-subunit alcohol dehydrogenase family)